MYGHETTCGYASRALGDTMLALQNNGMKHSEGTLRTMLFRMMLARIWHNIGGPSRFGALKPGENDNDTEGSRDETNRPLRRGGSAAATDRQDMLFIFSLAKVHSGALDEATSRIEGITLLTQRR